MDNRAKAFLKLIKMDESGELKVRSYSGRGMMGQECIGLDGRVSDIITNLVALALEQSENLTQDERDDIVMLLSRGCSTDSMGLGSIVYFPGCKVSRAEMNEYLDNEEFGEEEDEDTDD